jgi:hypothetical protein
MLENVLRRRYTPSVVQQLPWSRLLRALRAADVGGSALVPTTSIGSARDTTVRPALEGPFGLWHAAYALDGPNASVFDVVDLCGGNTTVEHVELLWNPVVHTLVFAALESPSGKAELESSDVDRLRAHECKSDLAEGIDPAWRTERAKIIPTIVEELMKQDVSGWPEVALRDYAL